MAGGPKITDNIQQLIVDAYLEHPDWVAKQVQEWVDNEVRKNKLAVKGPGLSAVQKKLAEYRASLSKQASLNTLKTPWSLGSLCQDDMSPETIPLVLSVQKFLRDQDEKPLTIPEAKWVARLSRFFDIKSDRDALMTLSLWAKWYATRELATKVANIPLDTTDSDLAMAAGKIEVIAKYVGTTNMISEIQKRSLGEEWAHTIEQKMLGKSLGGCDLSGIAWFAYIYGMKIIVFSDKWENKDQMESPILDLRDWIIKNQQDPNLFEDIDIRWGNEIEEKQNERPHSQTVQG